MRGLDGGPSEIVYKRPSNRFYSELWLPCSTCPGCLADRALAWSIRAYQESTLSDSSCFITLTYDDAHLPSDGLISVDALQRFFKRVRKDLSIRYIACGEYGDLTRRPHYHALIFGTNFRSSHDIPLNDKGDFSSALLSKYWPFGNNVCAPLSMATCCYVTGYVVKKQSDSDTFRLSSRRPPIGKPWFDLYSDNVKRLGFVVIEGKKLPVPPQYFDWDLDGELNELKRERRFLAQKLSRSKSYTQKRIDGINKARNKRALNNLHRGVI